MAAGKRGIGMAKVLFAFAALLLLGAIVVTVQYLSTSEERALESFDSAEVLVAAQPIARGTSLFDAQENQLLELKTYPVETLPGNSIQEVTASNGNLVAQADLAPGQILVSEIFAERAIPSIALEIPTGSVAVTVELEYAARVASFVKPGVNVAVYSTSFDQNNKNAKTSLLFRTLRVLAVGTQTSIKESSSEEEISNYLTFAVQFDEADKLIKASQDSKLYLALLNESSFVGAKIPQN